MNQREFDSMVMRQEVTVNQLLNENLKEFYSRRMPGQKPKQEQKQEPKRPELEYGN